MNATTLLGGLGLGAGLMYLFDPQMGRRRRAEVRHKVTSLLSNVDDAAGVVAHDLSQRAQGVLAEARSMLEGEAVSDRVLAERVRSRLGRVVSHPGSVEVEARDGKVTLRGPVLAHEVDDLLRCVWSVRGVDDVEDRLEVHEQPGDVPGLQGAGRRPGSRWELLQTNWSPATRLVVGAAGGLLAAFGLTRRAPAACVLGTVGLALAARGLSNLPFAEMVGAGGGRGLDVHKAITINAPPDRVFSFWSVWTNFPRFMRNVREVTDLGGGRSRWVAAGPAGVPVAWEARVTRVVPNEEITWESEPGSAVSMCGKVRFDRNPDGGTRATVQLSYRPPAGALGHAVAGLFGADPKTEMDEDLMRMKSLVETGKLPHDAREKEGAGAR